MFTWSANQNTGFTLILPLAASDFDAIMDILEEEDLDGQFESLVSDVSMELQKYLLFQLHHSKILSYKLLVRTLVSLCLVYPY